MFFSIYSESPVNKLIFCLARLSQFCYFQQLLKSHLLAFVGLFSFNQNFLKFNINFNQYSLKFKQKHTSFIIISFLSTSLLYFMLFSHVCSPPSLVFLYLAIILKQWHVLAFLQIKITLFYHGNCSLSFFSFL